MLPSPPLFPAASERERERLQTCWQQALPCQAKTHIVQIMPSHMCCLISSSTKRQWYACRQIWHFGLNNTNILVLIILISIFNFTGVDMFLFTFVCNPHKSFIYARLCCFCLMLLSAFICNSRETFICVLTRQHNKTQLRTTKHLSADKTRE